MEEDEIEEDEDEEQPKTSQKQTKSSQKTQKHLKHKQSNIINYDPVTIPMGERSVDKLLSWRATDAGNVEVLVKFKVFII